MPPSTAGCPRLPAHTARKMGHFTKENTCVINFAGKSSRSVSLRKLIFKNTEGSWTSVFRFGLPLSLERERTVLEVRPGTGDCSCWYCLCCVRCRRNEWWRSWREIKHVSLRYPEGSIRVKVPRFLWNLFIYIGECCPCLFGSGEICAPPLWTVVSFSLWSLDAKLCLLGMGGWQHGKSRKCHAKLRPFLILDLIQTSYFWASF